MNTLTDAEMQLVNGGGRTRSRSLNNRDAVFQAMTQLQSTISSLANQQPRQDALLMTVAMAALLRR